MLMVLRRFLGGPLLYCCFARVSFSSLSESSLEDGSVFLSEFQSESSTELSVGWDDESVTVAGPFPIEEGATFAEVGGPLVWPWCRSAVSYELRRLLRKPKSTLPASFSSSDLAAPDVPSSCCFGEIDAAVGCFVLPSNGWERMATGINVGLEPLLGVLVVRERSVVMIGSALGALKAALLWFIAAEADGS